VRRTGRRGIRVCPCAPLPHPPVSIVCSGRTTKS
jgi:hypothetical protein